MEMTSRSLVLYFVVVFSVMEASTEATAATTMFSSRLIHRFSEEAKALGVPKSGNVSSWPVKKSLEYYQKLLSSDFQKHKMKLEPHFKLLFPSQGSKTMSLGNDFGWLHYTWIDIGTPNISFLVALDAGSDLFWVPCDCVQCAPLSASYYSSLVDSGDVIDGSALALPVFTSSHGFL